MTNTTAGWIFAGLALVGIILVRVLMHRAPQANKASTMLVGVGLLTVMLVSAVLLYILWDGV